MSHCSTRQTSFVIDTDAGTDDFRALCMLLASPSLNIKAVITSDGNVDPFIGALKVHSLLVCFHNDNILVGCGEKKLANPPPWRTFAENFSWGTSSGHQGTFQKSLSLLETQCSIDTAPFTIICLGPLTNIAAFIETFPAKKSHIGKIIWLCDSAMTHSFNYYADSGSAQSVLSSGIAIDIINPVNGIALDTLENVRAKRVITVYASEMYAGVKRIMDKGHRLGAFDDFIPLYLNYPDLFKQRTSTNSTIRNFVFKGDNTIFNNYITIIPTRKATKKYLQGQNG
jgi:hypothetical protein